MKVRIDFEESLVEDEIIIKCKRIDDTIQRIQNVILDVTQTTQKLSFYKDDKEYYLPVTSILFFETSNNSIDAHTADNVYHVKYKLYELEKLLPKDFLRVSKSTILNINHVLSITRNITSSSLVQLNKTHKQVYVSRYYFKDLREKLKIERRNNYEI